MKHCLSILLILMLSGTLAARVPGDLSGDGRVDLSDLDILSAQWLQTPGDPSADIAPSPVDDWVDFLDFGVLAAHWLLTAPDPDEMVFLTGGTFAMGNHFPGADPNEPDEQPVHGVTVDAFYLGKYEVTHGRFCEFLNDAISRQAVYVVGNVVYGATGSDPNQPYCRLAGGSDSLIVYADGVFSVLWKGAPARAMTNDPVVFVSWYGAAAYCNWRSEQDGYPACYDLAAWTCDFARCGYRLPTEAEWEYAARAGQSSSYTRFSWGDTISHDQANYYSTWSGGSPYYAYDVSPTEQWHPDWNDGIEPYTAPVGSFPANGLGLYDMAGNAWEWCQDWYDSSYYSNPDAGDNPTGPAAGKWRLLRGGSWHTYAGSCRSANRHYYPPDSLRSTYGFRLCLNLP